MEGAAVSRYCTWFSWSFTASFSCSAPGLHLEDDRWSFDSLMLLKSNVSLGAKADSYSYSELAAGSVGVVPPSVRVDESAWEVIEESLKMQIFCWEVYQ